MSELVEGTMRELVRRAVVEVAKATRQLARDEEVEGGAIVVVSSANPRQSLARDLCYGARAPMQNEALAWLKKAHAMARDQDGPNIWIHGGTTLFVGVAGGSFTYFDISGTAAGRQLLEVKAFTGGDPPASVRLAIVRIQ